RSSQDLCQEQLKNITRELKERQEALSKLRTEFRSAEEQQNGADEVLKKAQGEAAVERKATEELQEKANELNDEISRKEDTLEELKKKEQAALDYLQMLNRQRFEKEGKKKGR
ncbi:MAG: hypothetical protein AAGJ31_04290, partial [Verrucomicrobiota bacterium]